MLLRGLLFIIMSFFAVNSVEAQISEKPKNIETAIIAAGCFWCIESDYDKVNGVITTTSGYIGGSSEDASYKKVSSGQTNHYEALKIEYDADKLSYNDILNIFWRNHDLFDDQGQFCDKGGQYRAGVFVLNQNQRKTAESSKQETQKLFTKPIVTQIMDATNFYPAEDYHQDYHIRNPIRYKFYRGRCGRDNRLKEIWQEKNPS